MRSIQSGTFLRDSVTEYFSRLPGFGKEKERIRILIGFSGGPDSVCLMTVLDELSENLNIDIVLAYFNHRIRPAEELAEEMAFIRTLAAEKNLELHIGEDAGEIERDSVSLGVECAARKARYGFFHSLLEKTGCRYLALAHNLDDTVETIVMRFFKGSGLSGLRGIPSVRGHIIRPLSGCPKKTILQFLSENNIPFSIDKTNYGTDYLRNRVRNILIPQIEGIFPSYAKAVTEFGEKVSCADDFIKAAANERVRWERTSPDENSFVTSLESFMSAPDALKVQSIYSCYDIFAKGRGGELPYRFVRTALSGRVPENNGVLLRGYGFVIKRAGNLLVWKKDVENREKTDFFIKINEKTDNFFKLEVNRGFSVEKSLLSLCNKEDIWIPAECVKGDLTVRSRRDGDSIVSSGCRKKLKKIFSEWKVPAELRSRIPLICDDRGVIAVWGGIYGYRDRVSDLVRLENRGDENGEVYIFRKRQDNGVR